MVLITVTYTIKYAKIVVIEIHEKLKNGIKAIIRFFLDNLITNKYKPYLILIVNASFSLGTNPDEY
jgi:predicted KAP-like P-loop ATPase